MKRLKTVVVVMLLLGIGLVGCGQQKAGSSSEAINTAKAMQTVEEKANYLVGQAKAFYSSKEFQQAVDVARYVLSYVDKDSQAAKDLLEKAKTALTEAAKAKLDEAKKGLKF